MTRVFRYAIAPYDASEFCPYIEAGTVVTADGCQYVRSEHGDVLVPMTDEWLSSIEKATADGADRLEALGFLMLKRAYSLRSEANRGKQ